MRRPQQGYPLAFPTPCWNLRPQGSVMALARESNLQHRLYLTDQHGILSLAKPITQALSKETES